MFFFSLFHCLMEPLAASLWCTGASCDCSHDQLHLQAKRICPALGMPSEDWRLKLESLSVQTFAYALTMVSNQLCWSTSIPHWTWIQIKYIVDREMCSAMHYQPKQPKTLLVLNQGGARYETEADLWYQAQQAADTLPNTQTGRRHPNWSQAPKLVAATQASEPNMIKPNPDLLEGSSPQILVLTP